MTTPLFRLPVAVLLLLLLGGPSCRLHRFTKEGADREVYGILDRARPCVPQVAGTVDVEAADRIALATRAERSYTLTLGVHDVQDAAYDSGAVFDFFRLIKGPEPNTFLLVASGLLGLNWYARRHKAPR